MVSDRKIKILHVITTLSAGGAEKLLNDSLPLYDRNIFDVELFVCTLDNSFFIQNLIDNNIVIHKGKSENIRSILNFFELKRIISMNNYDVIHGHLFPINYWLSIINVFNNNFRYFYTEHNTHNRRRDIKLLKPFESFVYKKMDKVISISEGTRDNLLDWLGINKLKSEKYVIVHNGIDLAKFNDAIPYEKITLGYGINNEDKLILMVGSLSDRKNQGLIIKAIRTLESNVKLILVGDGPRKAHLVKLVDEYGLENRVIFLGLRDDVPSLNKTADIIVVSSKWEGFGLVAVEGMSSGTPVIGSNVPGLSNVIGNKEFMFHDEFELKTVITKLLTEEAFRELCINEGLKKSSKYSIYNMVKEYSSLYIGALEGDYEG